jgi:hypothetical protein
MKPITHWTLFAAIAFSTGCSALDKEWKKKLPWSNESKVQTSKFETPTHMIAIWSPDVLSQPGKPPTRGFGGRFYFYNDKNRAVLVEGQLVVYGYDDVNDPHRPGEPQRKFVFTPDQFASHQSTSDLGPSYSIWIPWDAAGGDQAQVSLVPVFTATSGKIVMGQQAMNVLPGRTKANAADPMLQQQSPQFSSQAPVESPAAGHAPQQGVTAAAFAHTTNPLPKVDRLQTTTIRLTPSLQKRLAQATDATAPQMSGTALATGGTMVGDALPGASALPLTYPAGVPPTRGQQVNSPAMPGSVIPQQQPSGFEVPGIIVPTAGSPGSPAPDQSSAHSEHSRFQARAGLSGRASPPAPWTPPYPVAPPSALRRPSW